MRRTTMRWRSRFGCLALIILSTGMSGCLHEWVRRGQPQSDSRNLPVQHFAAEGLGSAAPTVKMWQQFHRGSSATQQEIDAFMRANPRGGYFGDRVTTGTLELALAHFGGAGAVAADYNRDFEYYPGRRGQAQAIADLQASIERGRPPAVQMYQGSTYAIAKAVGWTLRPNPQGFVQPSSDWFRIHLPNGVPDIYFTMVDMENYFTSSVPWLVIAFFTSASDQRAVTSVEWAEYDALGGTYYGDPNPPAPECPPHCPRIGVPEGKYRLETDLHSIPVLNPKTDAEVEKDLIAGLVRTGLDREIGLEPLTAPDGKLRVKSIQRVHALSEVSDYFLIQIATVDGAPYALATVNATGWLGSVTLDHGKPHVMIRSLGQTSSDFEVMTGVKAESIQMVFAFGTLCPTQFQPVYLITSGKDRFYLTLDGGVFQETGDPAQSFVRQRNVEDQPFLYMRDRGKVTLSKLAPMLQ